MGSTLYGNSRFVIMSYSVNCEASITRGKHAYTATSA
jgi:hypothetical protein